MPNDFIYLQDSSFLKKFDEMKLKEQLVKIIVLTFDEKPIAEVQGIVTGGNITMDGSSAMRRTCNISFIADPKENNLSSTKYLLSMNKKVKLLIGFKNITDYYPEYPILWFPQGTYVIITPNITRDSNGTNISLTLHDKMAFLNGQCGGVFPATVAIDELQTQDEDGNSQVSKITIYQTILELVNHWGGEQLEKILIDDVDLKLKMVVKWIGNSPLFIYESANAVDGVHEFSCSTNQESLKQQFGNSGTITAKEYGDDVGYILSDFTYSGELIANAGETVVTVLDKIKAMLGGNYEYFYDINGNFVFREIRNFLNTTYATFKINQLQKNNYLVDYTHGKSVYSFNDGHLILSYTNNPQYQQIKNDFIIWGIREDKVTSLKIPIRYHLVIDKKPIPGKTYSVFFYEDDYQVKRAKKPILQVDNFNILNDLQGEIGGYYYVKDEKAIYRWSQNPKEGVYKKTDYTLDTVPATPLEYTSYSSFPNIGKTGNYYKDTSTEIIYRWENVEVRGNNYIKTDYKIKNIITTDFRQELYFSTLNTEPNALQKNYYYQQIIEQWPKIWDIQNHCFYENVIKHPDQINYFLDFIDTTSSINELNVNNIGRRTHIINSDKINCVFQPQFNDIVYIQLGQDDTEKIRNFCKEMGLQYNQVDPDIFSKFAIGGYLNSAYQEIKNEIYQYTNYNEQISLTTIPIYYLQPNSRITVQDMQSGIFGDFIIKTISLPLGVAETMSISCIKALERI